MNVDGGEKNAGHEDFVRLLKDKIENLRPKLLDLSRRNPLISARLGPRSGSFVQIVDELPDVLAFNLAGKRPMRFVPLPSLDDDPKDEQTREFLNALSEAKLIDEAYLEQQEKLDPDAADALDRGEQIERNLKDRVRALLGMPPRGRPRRKEDLFQNRFSTFPRGPGSSQLRRKRDVALSCSARPKVHLGIVTLTAWLRHGRCFSVSGCARYPTVVTAFHRSSSSMPSGSIAVSR